MGARSATADASAPDLPVRIDVDRFARDDPSVRTGRPRDLTAPADTEPLRPSIRGRLPVAGVHRFRMDPRGGTNPIFETQGEKGPAQSRSRPVLPYPLDCPLDSGGVPGAGPGLAGIARRPSTALPRVYAARHMRSPARPPPWPPLSHSSRSPPRSPEVHSRRDRLCTAP